MCIRDSSEAIKFSPLEEEANAEASFRTQVVNYALQFLGNPYVWGGTSLTNGCLLYTSKIYATNQILDVLQLDEYAEPDAVSGSDDLESILKELLDYAACQGILREDSITYRDLFDTRPVSYTHLDVYKRQV